jgi:hypothetical protein
VRDEIEGGKMSSMKPPIYVRELSDAERTALEAGVRSADGFTVPSMRQKKRRDWVIAMAGSQRDFVLGFEDEVWWSREAQTANA